MKYLAATLFSVTGVVSAAQQVQWGQCGGEGYTGPTECVDGTVCQYSNQWYSQCVPGTATTTAGATTTAPTTISQTSSRHVPTSTGFASANGTKFTIDGETKYFAGTNSYWISFLTNNADVDTALDALVNSGLKILRIWGFNDVTSDPGSGTVYFQYLSANGSVINTGANGLQRLDYIVSAAEARGLKLIIPLVNNWDNYGGMPAYVQAFGLSSKNDWYESDVAQTQYKKYVQAVVSRYVDSPAIFAWELTNEAACEGCSTDVIFNWASEASAYVKSLDPNHMVALGDQGFGLPGEDNYFYQYSAGTDWIKNLEIETLDFATIHMYPTAWGQSNDFGSPWIKAHADACAAKGVPCLLEEYGSTTDHCTYEKPWQNLSLAIEGMGGDLFWQLGTTLSTGPIQGDTYTIYTGTDEWQCIVTDHVAAINALS